MPASKKAGESVVGRTEPVPPELNSVSEPKKKTPTQLRRERKKRQKEREKRQREIEKRTLEEGEEKGGRGSAHDKAATLHSASTSGTTSPLSSIENSVSDTQRESTSLSLSQSPSPPADEDITSPEQVAPQESGDLRSSGSAVGVATMRPEMKGEEHSPGKEVRKERPFGRASPTIEWDGCRKTPNLSQDKNYPKVRIYESYKSSHYSSKRVKNLHEKTGPRQQLATETVPKHRGVYSPLSNKGDNSLVHCNGSVNGDGSGLAHVRTESRTKPLPLSSSYSHTSSSHYNHKQLPPFSPTSSTDDITHNSYSHPAVLNSDGQNSTPCTGDLAELSCVTSKLERSADSSQSIIMNGHEE